MRKILLFLLFLTAINTTLAQELKVKSFKVATSDLTAQTQPRKDLNDRNCALIKVGIALDGVKFDGSIMGEPVHKVGEYWVYMPQGVSMLQVLHKDYTPLMINFFDYDIGKVESGVTYVLTLTKPALSTEQQTQSLTIKYAPLTASVLVDNKFVKGANGVAQITLPVGQHSFVVACDGYESEEGMVKLKASAPSNLQITLSKEATSALDNQSTVAQQSIETTVTYSDLTLAIPVKDDIKIEMIRVNPGTFTLKYGEGKFSSTMTYTFDKDFFIGKYEVTQALWKAVMGSNPSKFKDDNRPVEQVSWNDCQEFISKLNNMTGRDFRLPSDSELLYAGRGGNKSKGYQYSGSNHVTDVAWCKENSKKTQPVGLKQPNELGFFDMTGNVWEWCENVASRITPDSADDQGFARYYIYGGSWYNEGSACNYPCIDEMPPELSNAALGLRLALSD